MSISRLPPPIGPPLFSLDIEDYLDVQQGLFLNFTDEFLDWPTETGEILGLHRPMMLKLLGTDTIGSKGDSLLGRPIALKCSEKHGTIWAREEVFR